MNVSDVVVDEVVERVLRPRSPPPRSDGPSRRKPVAIIASSVRRVSSSPASLLADELSYGLSLLKRLDDVVAVAPGLRAIDVELEAAGVGVADQVEPVARPALAVVRARV